MQITLKVFSQLFQQSFIRAASMCAAFCTLIILNCLPQQSLASDEHIYPNGKPKFTIEEIERRLNDVTREGYHRYWYLRKNDPKFDNSVSWYQNAMEAVQDLIRHDSEDAVKMIALALASYSDSIRMSAAEALRYQNSTLAIGLARLVLLNDKSQYKFKLNESFDPGGQTRETVARSLNYLMHLPGAVALADETLSRHMKNPHIARRVAEGFKNCHAPRCLDIAKKYLNVKDTFVSGYLIAGLANQPDSEQLLKLLNKAFATNSHWIQLGVAQALVAQDSNRYFELVKKATRAGYFRTRIYAYRALMNYYGLDVKPLYENGLKDSMPHVRIMILKSLQLRTEPWSNELLARAAIGYYKPYERSKDEQFEQMSARERWGSFLKETSLNNPSTGYLETFDRDKWSADRTLQDMKREGVTESSIALKLLQLKEGNQTSSYVSKTKREEPLVLLFESTERCEQIW